MPTKFRVSLTCSAEEDIEQIWTYIAADSPGEATKFIAKLENQILTLEHHPLRCPLIAENALLGTEIRHLVYGPYRTLFRIAGKTVYVLRILHGSRLLDDSLFDR